MKKILILSSDLVLARNVMDLALYVGKSKGCFIKGLFFSTLPKFEIDNDMGSTSTVETATELSPAIKEFEAAVMVKGYHHTSSILRENILEHVLEETKFADLLIFDPSISPEHTDAVPSAFIREILTNTRCPILVAPLKFEIPEEIVFSYDGSDSSLYAIKQFTYLFPDMNETPVSVLQVLPDGKTKMTERKKLVELLMLHYNSLNYEHPEGEDAAIELFRQFVGKRSVLLVMGAYGRKHLSIDFSTADILIKNLDIPVFIAHN